MKKWKIKEDAKQEWIMREYGSYEDSGKSENHVVAILERSPKGFVVSNTNKEQSEISKSAMYCASGYNDEDQIADSREIARFKNF